MSDHSFIKEVIKEKPLDKKRLFFMAIILVIAAVIFGVIGAFSYAFVLPYAKAQVAANQKPGMVKIAADEEEQEKETETPTPTPEEPTATPLPEEKLGLTEYKQLYQEMKTASRNAQSSVVTVIGIKSEVDYFNNAYDNSGQLSGVVIANNSRELLILTEYGIVEGRDRIQVTFSNGKTVDAQYQKHDPNTRLVILKVPLESVDQDTLETIQMAPLGSSYGLSQGEPVIALGSPMGYGDSMAFGAITSMTNTVSGFDTEYSLVSTDILGSKEGSGILVNLEGEIVGVIAQAFSMEGHTITALSISEIKTLIQTLSNNGTIPYVGIEGQDVTEAISRAAGIPQGVYVENMKADSPAVQAGMMNGDVIVKFGDEKVTTIGEYQAQVEKCQGGEVVKITVMRKGVQGYEEIVFDVTVQAL